MVLSSDDELPQRKRQKRGQGSKSIKLTPALYKAKVTTLAHTGSASHSSTETGHDENTLQRIKKCLERANHPNTPDAEAKAAFHMASRLMDRHNITQAEVLAHESPETQKKYAGQSTTTIRRADGSSKAVNQQQWVDHVVRAMMSFFDCQSYSASRDFSVEWTFYGIAENTVAAAMAFEMAYNLIVEWARPHKGIAIRYSYCTGAANELRHMATSKRLEDERKAEEAEKEVIKTSIEQEQVQREEELRRLTFVPNDRQSNRSPSPISSQMGDVAISDDDSEGWQTETDDDTTNLLKTDFKVEAIDDDLLDTGDIDEAITRRIKPEPSPSVSAEVRSDTVVEHQAENSAVKKEPEEEGGEAHKDKSVWASSMQLALFRGTADRIAEDYLKDQGVKLTHHKRKKTQVRDWKAYRSGQVDGRKIDVYQRRIKDEAASG